MDDMKQNLEQLRSDVYSAHDPWTIRSVGAKVLNAIREMEQPDIEVRIKILAQCSVHELPAFIAAHALSDYTLVYISIGDYDAVISAIDDESEAFDVYILIPWVERNGRSFENNDETIDYDISLWSQVWERLLKKQKRVFQVSADYCAFDTYESELGRSYGVADYVEQLNLFFRTQAPDTVDYIDLNQLSAHYGKSHFYSRRNYCWTKSPFTTLGINELCRYLWARIKVSIQGRYKVLVLDLDYTLWGGVIGESNLDELDLGESMSGAAYVAFQKYLLGLSARGVLLAVASKNNEEDARRVFKEHSEMVLKESDIVSFKASWNTKSQMIREIASELNVGLDSIVFFDDSYAERLEVMENLPKVKVLEVPDEPADFADVLRNSYCFGYKETSLEDRQRSKYYLEEQKRQLIPQTGSNYLEKLALRGVIFEVELDHIGRVAQLIGKTNQFNLTTKRYSRPELAAIIDEDANLCLALKLKDSIGEYGIVGVALLIQNSALEYTVDTFLLSCRALSRGAEEFLFNAVLERLSETSCQYLNASYTVSPKNRQVSSLWNRFGFDLISEQDNRKLFRKSLVKLKPIPTYVRSEK